MDWNTHVLRDLLYERMRQHVDLVSIVDLEHEIAESIERAVAGSGGESGEPEDLGRRLLDEAWRRLESEWNVLRDAECPLCSELTERSRAVT
jgi:hypothetical protein